MASLIDLKDSLPLTRALREYFPPGRTGNPVALSTATRWINRGILAPNGERVFLEAVRVGGVSYITPEAAQRFIDALNDDQPGSRDANPRDPESDPDFQRRAKEAGAVLEKLGA